MKYVNELDNHIQQEIKKALAEQRKQENELLGIETDDIDIEEHVVNGMDSKVSDLEDAIDMDKVIKEAEFKQLLLEEVIKDEYEYCFDRSYMPDEHWKLNNSLQTRTEAFTEVIEELKYQDTQAILKEYGSKYDYVYDKVRNGNDEQQKEILERLGQKNFVIHTSGIGYSEHQTIDSLFVDHISDEISYAENEINEEEIHNFNLLSTKERKELLEDEGYYFIPPTLENVKEWEAFTSKKFYKNVEFISREKATDIITSLKPEGQFISKDGDLDVYVGIDNTSSEAYVEEFKDLDTCVHWLDNKDYEPDKEFWLDYIDNNKSSERQSNKDDLER